MSTPKKLKHYKISAADYEDIRSEGYEECLRDMIDNIRNLISVVDEQQADLQESLEGFLLKAEESLSNDIPSIN